MYMCIPYDMKYIVFSGDTCIYIHVHVRIFGGFAIFHFFAKIGFNLAVSSYMYMYMYVHQSTKLTSLLIFHAICVYTYIHVQYMYKCTVYEWQWNHMYMYICT